MIYKEIEVDVQEILLGKSNFFDKCKYGNQCKSSLDTFCLNTANRVCKYFSKYRQGTISIDDFLVSLRNYLLLFQTTVFLQIKTDKISDYGIKQDGFGKYYAVINTPDYLKENLISQVFMRNSVNEEKKSEYFLGVSPKINRITGFKYFKSIEQKLAVNGALNMPDGYTTLVSLPTGGGKSLITQAMAYQKESGLSIVIVPTVSLAIDQVRVSRKNIKIAQEDEIACYYSELDSSEKLRIIKSINNQKLRLLFISPEALVKNELFKKAIDDINEKGYLKNIIIDEAHIVIEWGSFFRIDYQCLEPWRNSLLINNSRLKTVLLSATFERSTVEMLKSMFATKDKWIEVRCDALRKEPRFGLVCAKSKQDKNTKIVELLRVLPRPMVVYVTSPDQAETIKKLANEVGFVNIKTFTGKTKANDRLSIIEEWSDDEYDLIIATSAFGVGVDKIDVRTVLHLYLPENPNKYYQELGRGGRDGLPCLSIMCVIPDIDADSAFNMTDKVLSTPKIIGRWYSMLNSTTSKRMSNTYALDTSVKPIYSETDYVEYVSKADIQWNIYVILLLRRYNLINIKDMMVDSKTQSYFIRVEIIEDLLLKNGSETEKLISQIRDREWKKIECEFKTMRKAVFNGKKECWSEMFLNTYSRVSEYCAGCDNHDNIIEMEKDRFELVKRIDKPVKEVSIYSEKIFGGANEAMLVTKLDNYNVISKIIERDFSILVIDDENNDMYLKIINNIGRTSDISIMGIKEYIKLVDERNFYYVSGSIMVIYNDSMKDMYKKFIKVRNTILDGAVKVLHIFEKDVFFNEIYRSASSLIEGPYLESYFIERM